jgi:phospholipid-binding lipoprotein MlaA
MKNSLKRSLMASALAAMMLTSGCSTPPTDPDARAAYDEANDPWEDFNRYIFELNYAFDQLLFRPIAGMYRTGVPEPVRDAIHNVLRNARSPLILINDLLQGNLERARDTAGRFVFNTTLGLGGLIDFADTVMGIKYHDEDFGQTLGVWGFQEGWYMMLPIYGPSNPRDTVGLVVDGFIDPVGLVLRFYGPDYGPWARTVLTALDLRSRNIDTLDEVERTSIDYYATIRSLYRQRRDDEIRNGVPSANQGVPTISGQEPTSPVIIAPQKQVLAPVVIVPQLQGMAPLPVPQIAPAEQVSLRPE